MVDTIDRQKDLIEVSFIPRPRVSPAELIRIYLAEFATSLTDGFIGHEDATDESECFHIAVAEAEAEVEPDAMADDLGREAVVLITVGRWCVHATNLAYQGGAGQAASQVDNT
jgi:hypothetical protein